MRYGATEKRIFKTSWLSGDMEMEKVYAIQFQPFESHICGSTPHRNMRIMYKGNKIKYFGIVFLIGLKKIFIMGPPGYLRNRYHSLLSTMKLWMKRRQRFKKTAAIRSVKYPVDISIVDIQFKIGMVKLAAVNCKKYCNANNAYVPRHAKIALFVSRIKI